MVNHHFSPPFGRICLEVFPTTEQANLSTCPFLGGYKDHLGHIANPEEGKLLSLKLTARTWRCMVGRRFFPFGSPVRTVSFRESKMIYLSRFHSRNHPSRFPKTTGFRSRCRWFWVSRRSAGGCGAQYKKRAQTTIRDEILPSYVVII